MPLAPPQMLPHYSHALLEQIEHCARGCHRSGALEEDDEGILSHMSARLEPLFYVRTTTDTHKFPL